MFASSTQTYYARPRQRGQKKTAPAPVHRQVSKNGVRRGGGPMTQQPAAVVAAPAAASSWWGATTPASAMKQKRAAAVPEGLPPSPAPEPELGPSLEPCGGGDSYFVSDRSVFEHLREAARDTELTLRGSSSSSSSSGGDIDIGDDGTPGTQLTLFDRSKVIDRSATAETSLWTQHALTRAAERIRELETALLTSQLKQQPRAQDQLRSQLRQATAEGRLYRQEAEELRQQLEVSEARWEVDRGRDAARVSVWGGC